jgi:hypothetical protein
MAVPRDEAVTMTGIAICGIGCVPVSAAKREGIEELLTALWDHAFASGYQAGLRGP